ncbi:hypothetical protein D3C76_1741680 [compost metagenome]
MKQSFPQDHDPDDSNAPPDSGVVDDPDTDPSLNESDSKEGGRPGVPASDPESGA